jgi:hypothetical protein
MISPGGEGVTRGGKSVIDVNATGGKPTTEDARAGRPSSRSAVEEASPGIDVVGSAGALVENGGAGVGSTAGAADLDSPDCDSVLGASSRRSTAGMLTSVASGASTLEVLIRPKPVVGRIPPINCELASVASGNSVTRLLDSGATAVEGELLGSVGMATDWLIPIGSDGVGSGTLDAPGTVRGIETLGSSTIEIDEPPVSNGTGMTGIGKIPPTEVDMIDVVVAASDD